MGEVPIYRDRADAGAVLAARLGAYARRDDVAVLALPRGGIPVAAPIARLLAARLDILAVRKLGVPGQEELAMGAIAAGPTGVVQALNEAVVSHLGIGAAVIEAVTDVQRRRLADLEARLRGPRPAVSLQGRFVILVDDGLATGSTMEAAILSSRQAGVSGIVVAVPIGAPSTIAHLATLVDAVVCPAMPERFHAVGLAYADFAPVSDEEAVALLYRGPFASSDEAPQS